MLDRCCWICSGERGPASFCMTTIVPLRLLAILSNMLFGLYGVSAHLYPVFLLHSILLPINLFKLARGASQTDRPPRKSGPRTSAHQSSLVGS